ncbi:MAG: CheR family methyltransferase [Myxococcota bacterium]
MTMSLPIADVKPHALRLSDREFSELRALIESTLGIQISDSKRLMLETRIMRRMRELSLDTISAYCDRLRDKLRSHQELQHFFDLVTTNKTSFFREPSQLQLLTDNYLGDYLRAAQIQQRPLRVWSAACSSGQEVWTLCMMLENVRARLRLQADFVVLGSDVSSRVLKVAIAAKYASSELNDVPHEYRSHFMKSRDPSRGLVRVTPFLRQRAAFVQLNLMNERYELDGAFDIVLLRNALIYFPRERQLRIIERVHETLLPGGIFAVGLTETLHGVGLPLQHVGSSIYLKQATR